MSMRSVSEIFFAFWNPKKVGSGTIPPESFLGSGAEDKILMEPLANHHFVQGDIEHDATVRQVEELLCGRQVGKISLGQGRFFSL